GERRVARGPSPRRCRRRDVALGAEPSQGLLKGGPVRADTRAGHRRWKGWDVQSDHHDDWRGGAMSNPDIDPESHRRLQLERDRLQAVFEAIGTGLLIADQFGVVNTVNAEATRLLGPAASLVGRPVAALLMIGDTQQAALPLLDEDWLSTIAVQRRWQVENIRLWPKGGDSFLADCAIVPFHTVQLPAESD